MSQVTQGLRFADGFSILVFDGDPNAATAPDQVKRAGLNYAGFRRDAPDGSNWEYRCSQGATFQNGVLLSAAVWVAK